MPTRMQSFTVFYKGSTKRVRATTPLAAAKKAFRAPKGSLWTATLTPEAIRSSAVILSKGSIVGRAMLQEKA